MTIRTKMSDGERKDRRAEQESSRRKRVKKDKGPKPIGTLDFETDPFKADRLPKVFACGYYNGETYKDYWGADGAHWLIHDMLMDPVPRIIYAHNGGRFDFHYILGAIIDAITSGRLKWWTLEEAMELINPFMINNRIAKLNIGLIELRDSYCIMPFPLSTYKKTEMDYSKMEEDVREQHKPEIMAYLKDDCMFLFDLVKNFWDEFGDHLTIGGMGLGKLTELHPWDHLRPVDDQLFRDFYFGGRVQAFETGVIKGDFNLYDINSQYPFVMANYLHPTSATYSKSQTLTENTDFAIIDAWSNGALPARGDDGLNCYPVGNGRYWATGHEIRAALRLGLLKIWKVQIAYEFTGRDKFDKFVDMFYAKRKMARLAGEKGKELFYKYGLNAPYGKLGQNPRNWRDTCIALGGTENWPVPNNLTPGWDIETDWRLDYRHGEVAYNDTVDGQECPIWIHVFSKPSTTHQFNNVAAAASITGSARARLLEGLAGSRRVLYCDTDSILCEKLGEEPNAVDLGKYKFEGSIDTAYIHGKKMYVLMKDGKYVKSASKGIAVSEQEIIDLVCGSDIRYANMAPSFSIKAQPVFTKRTIKAKPTTMKAGEPDEGIVAYLKGDIDPFCVSE